MCSNFFEIYKLIENNNLPGLKNLISKGVNIVQYFGNAIILSSIIGNLDIIKYLFSLVNVQTFISKSDEINYALVCASEKGHIDIAKYLIYEGVADIEYNDRAAINSAKKYGHIELVNYLENMVSSNNINYNHQEIKRKNIEGNIDKEGNINECISVLGTMKTPLCLSKIITSQLTSMNIEKTNSPIKRRRI